MLIQGSRIWLTGASSGIGEALATILAAKGARLILSARRTDKLDTLKQQLPNSEQHLVIPLDLADPASIQLAVEKYGEQPLNLLINNGGITQRGSARETALAVQREVMEVNYFGTINLTQQLLPKLLASQGMVVNIASVAGKVGGQSMAGYAATKHALIGYMDSLRAEESRNGLKVLNICPGFVHTQISVNARTEQGAPFGEMADSIANGISAETCAAAIVSAIQKDKLEIVVGKGLSRWAPLIKRIAPNLLHRMAAKTNIR